VLKLSFSNRGSFCLLENLWVFKNQDKFLILEKMELLTIVPWFMGTEEFGGIFMFTNMGV